MADNTWHERKKGSVLSYIKKIANINDEKKCDHLGQKILENGIL